MEGEIELFSHGLGSTMQILVVQRWNISNVIFNAEVACDPPATITMLSFPFYVESSLSLY
jgi:hypothetical protein